MSDQPALQFEIRGGAVTCTIAPDAQITHFAADGVLFIQRPGDHAAFYEGQVMLTDGGTRTWLICDLVRKAAARQGISITRSVGDSRAAVSGCREGL